MSVLMGQVDLFKVGEYLSEEVAPGSNPRQLTEDFHGDLGEEYSRQRKAKP